MAVRARREVCESDEWLVRRLRVCRSKFGASDAEGDERRAVRTDRRRDVQIGEEVVQQRCERGKESIRAVSFISLAFLLRMSVVRERDGDGVCRLGARVLAERVFRYEERSSRWW